MTTRPPPIDKETRKRFRGYSGARPDVMRLISAPPRRVLDVGCGAGMTAALITEKYPGAVVIGIEPDIALANLARARMSAVIDGRVDDPSVQAQLKQDGSFDLIICADVLEHLAEPAEVLMRMTAMLTEGGHLITSIPNIRHVSTFVSLGLLGTWPARSRGIHDRTHLRFFARGDILALGRSAGLRLVRERRNLRLIEAAAWSTIPARLFDFWPFRAFLTFQYLHLWARMRDGDDHPA
jgi:SAM-dependent methyltransferase